MSDDASDSELGGAIAHWLELERAGRAPSVRAFAAQHPHIEAQLLACLDVVRDLSAPKPAGAGLPREIGDFRIVREIGRGGMGVVLEAEQQSLPRRVALKLLQPGGPGDDERRRRFRREIECTARLRHEGIVPVLEAGEADGLAFYAMPLLEGFSLERVLATWRAEPATAPSAERERLIAWLRRFVGIARALEYAHAQGVLHRDVKPSNLFLEDEGRLSLLDFGLTRSLGGDESALTQAPVGTPRYMSPEQIRGVEVGAASDQFSFAATLYEVLTLAPAFPGSERESVFHGILTRDAVAPRRLEARVPRDVEVILLKALEKQPARRYASMGELADDLERFLAYEPIHARPLSLAGAWMRRARRNPVATAALVVALLALVVLPLRAAVQAREATRAQVDRELALGEAARASSIAARERATGLEARRTRLVEELAPWASLDAKAPLRELERELALARDERERGFRDALTHWLAALQLQPANTSARRAIAAAAFDEYRDAERRRERERMQSLAPLVLTYDDGSLAEAWRGRGSLAVTSTPPGAQVFLFRYADRGALRLPVPLDSGGALDPAALAALDVVGPWSVLRLDTLSDSEVLHVGDELISVCGTPPHDAALVAQHLLAPHWGKPDEAHALDVRRGGARIALELPAQTALELGGAHVVRSAFPLDFERRGPVGSTPLAPLALEMGSYLAVLRDGPRVARAPFEVRRSEQVELSLDIDAACALEPEFAYVAAGRAALGGDVRALDALPAFEVDVPAFWIQRRETTFAEYFSFIAVLEDRAPSEAKARAPRQPGGAKLWALDADGRIRPALPPGVDASWPVVGVSCDDAEAYCTWFGALEARDELEFGLPSEVEWEKAARGVDGRLFVWGDAFDWTLARLGRSARVAGLARGGLYATDESVYGALDLGGGVREWCAGPPAEPKRRLRGGAWGVPVENDAHLASRSNERERAFVDTGSGFRVAARRRRE